MKPREKRGLCDELESIRLRSEDGILRWQDVVKFAKKNKGSVLHRQFEWDVSEAAKLYWRQRAEELIRVIVVYPTNFNKARVIRVRKYHSLPSDRAPGGGGYRHIESILTDEQMTAQLLMQARADLDAWLNKYRTLEELAPTVAAIEEAAEAIAV